MKRLLAVALATLFAHGLGCSDDQSSENADPTPLETSYRKFIETSCECESYRNGASAEVCVAAHLQLGRVNSTCERQAVSRREAADSLTCYSEAWLAAADCMAKSECEGVCGNEFHDLTLFCGWPDPVQAELDACPAQSFECAGGGSVEIDAVCDDVRDCEDGSDEVPC